MGDVMKALGGVLPSDHPYLQYLLAVKGLSATDRNQCPFRVPPPSCHAGVRRWERNKSTHPRDFAKNRIGLCKRGQSCRIRSFSILSAAAAKFKQMSGLFRQRRCRQKRENQSCQQQGMRWQILQTAAKSETRKLHGGLGVCVFADVPNEIQRRSAFQAC